MLFTLYSALPNDFLRTERPPEQRQMRRDANCVDKFIQTACPISCSDYISMKEEHKSHSSGIPQDIETLIPQQAQELKLNRAHITLPRDDCFDSPGYFLDSNSTLRQCDWLSDHPDPLDETRKISNCGYLEEATDLGRMCKASCGTCDW